MNFKRNSGSIYANQPRFYYPENKIRLSGKIELEIRAVDNLYVGSGFVNTDGKENYVEFIRYNSKPIIPGSSLKGCVRHIAGIVSNGCLSVPRKDVNTRNRRFNVDDIIDDRQDTRQNYRDNRPTSCKKDKKCIICDMFGMMGVKSKITFSDMIAENFDFDILELNQQHSPKVGKDYEHVYTDNNGDLVGYKLYMNDCAKYEGTTKEPVETVKSGAVFKGEVYFDRLTETELNLLCYALGLGGQINPKIGGYKNEGLGQVHITGKLTIDGKAADCVELAKKYPLYCEKWDKKDGNNDMSETLADVEYYLKSTEVKAR